jgi:hypothetical protein
MTPEEFHTVYPQVIAWVRQTLAAHRCGAKRVSEFGFQRLPLYVSAEFLESVSAVIVDRVPVPPLSSIGLRRFADFEMGDYDGITYLDTYFIKRTRACDEALHFHELAHVIQWRALGPERFLRTYADGLERFGYRNSPLERMAYDAERRFSDSPEPFDLEQRVSLELRAP